MVAVFIALIPMIIGSAIAPGILSLNLVVLRGANGVGRSAAFIIGAILIKLIQGLIFGSVFSASAEFILRKNETSPITSILFLFMGLMFAILGIRAYFHQPDPDAPPPRWMKIIEHLSRKELFLSGMLWALTSAKGWVFTLTTLSFINDANLKRDETLAVYLIYVMSCMAFFLIPLILCVIAPERADETLTRLENWITRHNRNITMIMGVVFGILFISKGIIGLIS